MDPSGQLDRGIDDKVRLFPEYEMSGVRRLDDIELCFLKLFTHKVEVFG